MAAKMYTLDEIRAANDSGNYYAITESGRKYEASYTTEYGGVMFFCIPSTEKIIGYKRRTVFLDNIHRESCAQNFLEVNGFKPIGTFYTKAAELKDGTTVYGGTFRELCDKICPEWDMV